MALLSSSILVSPSVCKELTPLIWYQCSDFGAVVHDANDGVFEHLMGKNMPIDGCSALRNTCDHSEEKKSSPVMGLIPKPSCPHWSCRTLVLMVEMWRILDLEGSTTKSMSGKENTARIEWEMESQQLNPVLDLMGQAQI